MSLLDQADQPSAKSNPPVLPATPTDLTRIAAAVEKIRAAGFGIQLLPGDKLLVTPRSQLSEAQIAWITKNKADILAYLRSLPDEHVTALQEQFGAQVKSIALPAPVTDEPTPEPTPKPHGVRCLECAHGQRFLPGDEAGGWRLCEAGLGGYFALAYRRCAGFVARASGTARKAA